MSAQENPEIFLSVIEANKGIIYKVAHSYCNHAEDRQDLVQEIILQLWRSFGNYNNEYRYSTWIYRIALNTAISFYRRESRRKQVSGPLPDSIISLADNPFSGRQEDLGLLQQFISSLKDLDKALMLLYLEEKSYKEIAEITGISESNAGTRIARIKQLLKQKFTALKH